MGDSNDFVTAGTRRVVGRATLRRLSRMAEDWKTEEFEKSRLAARLMVATAIIGLAAAALVLWF